MKLLVFFLFFYTFVFAKNVLIINAYSPTFDWTISQSNAIVKGLKKEEIKIFVEFMDTKEFKPTKQSNSNILRYYNEKYKDTDFDAIAVTDDNAINFVLEYQDEKIFANSKIFFSGINNTKLKESLDKEKFTGVFEVKKPLVNLEIAKQLNKNLQTIYLVGDGSVTSSKNITQYKQSLKNEKDLNFVYLNNSNIDIVLEKLKSYDKNSVMMLLVFSAFEKNSKHISDLKALEHLSKQYANPMITHDSVYVNIDNKNIIGGNCSDAIVAGSIVASDILKYFNGTKIKDIPFKLDQGNSTYLNEKVLNGFDLDIKNIKVQNPVIVNQNDSVFIKYKIWIYSIIILFVVMLVYIFIKVQQQKSLKLFNKKIQELNDQLEEKVKEKTRNLTIENKKFQSILDATMEGILLSKDGICIDVNKSVIELMGYDSKEEMIGKNMLSFVAEDSRELVKTKIIQDDVEPYEAFVLKKDGTTFPSYLRGYNTEDKSIRISSVLDITHLKQLESSSKMAAMGEMIGNIAHQWRQPLSIISSSATGTLLKQKLGLLDNAHLEESLTEINRTTQYLSETIDDFRDFIKGDTQQVVFNLSKDIESFLHLVNGAIKANNIHIIKELQSDIFINSYPNELKQCLINIFNNAKDAFIQNRTEKRFIFISAFIENDKAIITLKDNAGGIKNDILPKIFEPYFTTKHKSHGTGLGLSMTYNLIVEGMKGTIEASNTNYIYKDTEYVGVEFQITLPL